MAFGAARSTALALFHDERVYMGKFVRNGRHVEVQVLGERNWSVQRRHLKIIEESPAPSLPDDVRHAKQADTPDGVSPATPTFMVRAVATECPGRWRGPGGRRPRCRARRCRR
ncbi:hypothetical protein [Nonomuraea sp. NPDC003709]|uniref:ATP-binding protein n=1 Tax=Nonomuraea sp. NPDC003709 TaxID=3154450 RepID=UPI0033A24F9D